MVTAEEKIPDGIQDVFCVPVRRRKTEDRVLGKGEQHLYSRKDEWYLPKAEELGHGVSGSVHEVCKHNKDCDHVMKIIIFNPEFFPDSDRKQFLKEVELQKEAFRLGVAPEIIDSWICENPDIGVIIMPTLQKTLGDVLRDVNVKKEVKDGYVKDAFEILHTLHQNNIYHGDSHLQNFMVDFNNKLKIIDFGFAKIVYDSDKYNPQHSPEFFLSKRPSRPNTDYDILQRALKQKYFWG